MNARSLLLLLVVVGLGIASMPAYSICGDVLASSHYQNAYNWPCAIGGWPCPIYSERHWHVVWPTYASHTYSNARVNNQSMAGAWWAPGFSPNKSGNFGYYCCGGNSSPGNCIRCETVSTCSTSNFKANICH